MLIAPIHSASVIETLKQQAGTNSGTGLAYFHFNFRDSQYADPDVLLRSLLRQLLSRPQASGVLSRYAAIYADLDSSASLDMLLLFDETVGPLTRCSLLSMPWTNVRTPRLYFLHCALSLRSCAFL